MKKNPIAPPPIEDPASHAREQEAFHARMIHRTDAFRDSEVFHTTGQFGALKKGFVKHCGPTAVTNLILTLQQSAGTSLPPAEDLFLKVAAIGSHMGIYWNVGFTRLFGGTSDLLTWFFLKRSLYKAGLSGVRVGLQLPAIPALMTRALDRGNLLYLQLRHHPLYRNHHIICYGYEQMEEQGSGRKVLYFKVADGWVSHPRYIARKDLYFSHFLTVRPPQS